MVSLRTYTIVALILIFSCFFVQVGFAKSLCASQSETSTWFKPYPLLNEWYAFFAAQQECSADTRAFFNTLVNSDTLSTKLNQAHVSFDQFYAPLYHLLSRDWEEMKRTDSQDIQSDLSAIDHALKRAMSLMQSLDQDYFRSVVLLELPREFV